MILKFSSFCSIGIICAVTCCGAPLTTYNYFGNPFTSAASPFTTSYEVTGFFTVPTLAPNLPETNITSTVLSFSFSDGVTTNTGTVPYLIVAKTDSGGSIVAWDIREIAGSVPNNTGIFTCFNSSLAFNSCGATPEDLGYLNNGQVSASNTNRPGVWTSAGAAVPEPGTFTIVGVTGLGAFVVIHRRRILSTKKTSMGAFRYYACFGFGLFACSQSSQASNIVMNPGFEAVSGGWSGLGSGWADCGGGIIGAHTGSQFACVGTSTISTISQTLTTTPGAVYDLNFWLDQANLAGSSPNNYVAVSWGGTTVYDSRTDSVHNFANQWVNLDFPSLTAATNSTILAFSGVNIPSNWELDDVSATTSTPEPANIVAVASGLLSILACRYRRKREVRDSLA